MCEASKQKKTRDRVLNIICIIIDFNLKQPKITFFFRVILSALNIVIIIIYVCDHKLVYDLYYLNLITLFFSFKSTLLKFLRVATRCVSNKNLTKFYFLQPF